MIWLIIIFFTVAGAIVSNRLKINSKNTQKFH